MNHISSNLKNLVELDLQNHANISDEAISNFLKKSGKKLKCKKKKKKKIYSKHFFFLEKKALTSKEPEPVNLPTNR